jgi:Protein of unknown function (DUF2752)
VAQAPPLDTLVSAEGRGMLRRASVVAILGALVALGVHFDVAVCPTAAFIGVPCPGCGLTRATLALLHGQLGAALHFHPLVLVLAPLYFGLTATAALGYVAGARRLPARVRWSSRWLNPLAWALLCLVLGVWVARFFGAFGGPVPVNSLPVAPLRGWLHAAPPALSPKP